VDGAEFNIKLIYMNSHDERAKDGSDPVPLQV